MRNRPALLLLETGEVFQGVAWGGGASAVGEVVFNTSMTGYQEILTDPSYAGQLVVMTYPHMGNYGVNREDVESAGVQPAGLVVRDLARRPSNYRSRASLEQYLRRAGVPGIGGIDTRSLTRRIREGGAVMGMVAPGAEVGHAPALLERLRAAPDYGQIDFVERVSTQHPRRVVGDSRAQDVARIGLAFEPTADVPPPDPERHVVVLDYGVKYSILRNLVGRGLDVTVLPGTSPAEEVLQMAPAAVLLSNGPGDPARLTNRVATVRDLLGEVPVWGICLGHQLLAMALGAGTFKLKYGHRGANQPVLDRRTGRVAITSQNHGYAVDPDGLGDDVEITHLNLNDHTVEGLAHRRLDARSVQFHPEAGPGPRDARGFFDRLAEHLTGVAP